MVRSAVAQVLLFIAAIGVSTMLVGVGVTQSGPYAQSVEDGRDRQAAAADAQIAIIDDADADATYDGSSQRVTLYVKNVGGDTLEPDSADVLLNGEYVPPSETRVLGDGGDADQWRVDAVLELTIDVAEPLEAGEHRAVVEIETERDVLTFSVD
ncbi:archaeal flagellar protein G [Natronorubrum sp. FCH18a]|uniref:archaeal flagellar protein G n=1 Tax=Natronorubrum sp. FCH18a TaxID=3447018 RepID=UPI003F5177A2